jgi:short-subunit dehydrogenase
MKKINLAVITGASSGLGKAFAELLATQGVNLVIAARRTEELAQLAAELTQKYNVTVQILGLDLSVVGAAERLFEFATQNRACVDLLINNAGSGAYRNFLNTPLQDHQNVLNLNVVTTSTLSHLFANHMLKLGKPSYILNVSSIAAYQPVPRFAVYSATKSYVKLFSEVLSYELNGTNVSVSCLCPGGMKTPFLAKNNQLSKLDFTLMDPEKVAKIALKGLSAKKSLIIPGLMNQLSCFIPRFLPSKINMVLASVAMNLAIEQKVKD